MTKIVYFGNERLVSGLEKTDAPILTGLIEKGYDVVAVVSNYADSKSRNQRALEVAEIAKSHNIPLFLPHQPSDILAELRELHAEVAVLAAYGRIVKQEIIDLFPKGIINIHPSLLPRYRGPTPIETAILNGDTETGVSIMQLTAGMDEGPVYAQQEILLDGTETKFDLYEKVTNIASPLFFNAFPKIIDGSLHPQRQDNETATYSKLIQKSDGVIDWEQGAKTIEAHIRAYLVWPQSKTSLKNLDVVITKAEIIDEQGTPRQFIIRNNDLIVYAGRDALRITELKPLGKKEMPISAFLSGYRSQMGY